MRTPFQNSFPSSGLDCRHGCVGATLVDRLTPIFLASTTRRVTPVEQCTRGNHVMLGCWNDEAATREAIDSAGWMHSGDLAVMDEEGYVSIVGRVKDLIIRGGENIYPPEIEECLHTLPAVSQAQVIGLPCQKYSEEVMAWVKFCDGATASEGELIAHCRKCHLAHFKTPRHWKFVTEFPMTVTRKIQKYRMRDRRGGTGHRQRLFNKG